MMQKLNRGQEGDPDPSSSSTGEAESVLADQAFVRRLKQEDPAAIQKLWEDLYRDAIYIARRHKQSDDVGYDAAVAAYSAIMEQGIYRFQFNASFRRYCWMILSRKIFGLIRKDMKLQTTPLATELAHAEEDQPEATADSQTIWERIRACVEALKGNRWAVFEAIDLNGGTPAETAEALGLSRNNVNQLASRARRDVRRCLENLGFKSSEDVLNM